MPSFRSTKQAIRFAQTDERFPFFCVNLYFFVPSPSLGTRIYANPIVLAPHSYSASLRSGAHIHKELGDEEGRLAELAPLAARAVQGARGFMCTYHLIQPLSHADALRAWWLSVVYSLIWPSHPHTQSNSFVGVSASICNHDDNG